MNSDDDYIYGPWDVFVRRLAHRGDPFPITSAIEAGAAIRVALKAERRSDLGAVVAQDHRAGHYTVDMLPEIVLRYDGVEFCREVAGYQVTVPMPNDDKGTP